MTIELEANLVPQNPIITHIGLRGEYRARLFDEAGRLKYDSGWQPNEILNQGLLKVFLTGSCMTYMALGTSAAAVVTTQTGLQGSYLATRTTSNYPTEGSSAAPDYYTWSYSDYVFAPGTATGTINEFVMTDGVTSANALNDASIRAVLVAPIVKGALDQLTMEHKIWTYPDPVDKTGTITITGLGDYDYTLRPFGINVTDGMDDRSALINSCFGGVRTVTAFICAYASNEILDSLTNSYPDVSPTIGYFKSYTTSTGGSYPNYYKECTVIAGIDDLTGTFNKVTIAHYAASNVIRKGINIILGAVGTGDPITKPNTHELRLIYRIYSSRYTP